MTQNGTMFDIEDLTLKMHDVMKRFSVSRAATIANAIEGGHILNHAKAHLRDGEYTVWVKSVGMSATNAWNWRTIAETGLSVEEIIAKGGMSKVRRTSAKSTADGLKGVSIQFVVPDDLCVAYRKATKSMGVRSSDMATYSIMRVLAEIEDGLTRDDLLLLVNREARKDMFTMLDRTAELMGTPVEKTEEETKTLAPIY